MQGDQPFLINDHFFMQAISCPLKIPFLQQNSTLGSDRPVFRQRNKLHLRDAVALRYSHRKYTSASAKSAAKETLNWLKEDSVTICGAVLQTGERLTRIPILVKEKQRFTIVQVHGKLRKSSEQKALKTPGKRRSTAINLLKAAYRADVLSEIFPDAEIVVHFFFPDKHFRSEISHLHSMFDKSDPSPEVSDQFKKLFLNVDATEAVKEVLTCVPDNVAHVTVAGMTVRKAFETVRNKAEIPERNLHEINRHTGCSSCDYRLSNQQEKGCWSKNFELFDIESPQSHVYDLIGHGNQFLIDKGVYYQEKVDIVDGLDTIELLQKYGGSKFTIQQRRNLQILKSKGQQVPVIWMKKGIELLQKLTFPLHFIDFEAATFAIPMQRGATPYTPLYFQYSCHTLYENDRVNHSTWLQSGSNVEHIHKEFVESIASIDDIFQGTLIHYSPFEKQAINRISAEFNRNSMINSSHINLLDRLKNGHDHRSSDRFFDLSELVRDYYYNSKLEGSLGIKDVLISLLETEQKVDDFSVASNMFSGIGSNSVSHRDPYRAIQNGNSPIMDGAAAMHAWIAGKNGLLSKEETIPVSMLLEDYCKLDSLSMLAVYRHINQFTDKNSSKDIILF
jgi:hypothetical protein